MVKNMADWGREAAQKRYTGASIQERERGRAGEAAYKSKDGPLETCEECNSLQQPQDVQDMQDVGYDNDASGWVEGHGEPYPYFDKGNAWRKGRGL